jgi:hypothetical protein
VRKDGKDEVIEALKKLGFVHLETEEDFKLFGKLYWQIYYNKYEAEIEPVLERKPFEIFYTEGLEIVMELPIWGFYTYIYRAVCYEVYVIHISTGPYEKYWRIWIYDKEDLETIAQIEVDEGLLLLGCQKDLEDILPKLFEILKPAKIKIY